MSSLIQIFENSISSRVCDNLIYKFENNKYLEKGVTSAGYVPKAKITTDLVLRSNEISNLSEIYNLLNSKLIYYINEYRKITNFSLPINFINSEFLIMKYLKNEGHYAFHNDFHLTDNKSNITKEIGCCRILTYLFYLNTIDEGGETEFIDGTKIKPEKGKLLIFPATWNYVHKGNIPLSSNKYIVTGWLQLKNLNTN